MNASTLAKESVSLPRTGRTSSRSSRSTTIAPQISLPWVSAFTSTCGPALPLSKVCTNCVPVAERRWRSMSGASSSTGGGNGFSGFVVVVGMPMAVVMLVGVLVIMIMPMVRVPVIVIVRARIAAEVGAALGGVGRDGLQQPVDVGLHVREPLRLLARALVHVEAPVHLDLQAVAVARRIGKGAHQLHALVGVIHLDLVAHGAQRRRHRGG